MHQKLCWLIGAHQWTAAQSRFCLISFTWLQTPSPWRWLPIFQQLIGPLFMDAFIHQNIVAYRSWHPSIHPLSFTAHQSFTFVAFCVCPIHCHGPPSALVSLHLRSAVSYPTPLPWKSSCPPFHCCQDNPKLSVAYVSWAWYPSSPSSVPKSSDLHLSIYCIILHPSWTCGHFLEFSLLRTDTISSVWNVFYSFSNRNPFGQSSYS